MKQNRKLTEIELVQRAFNRVHAILPENLFDLYVENFWRHYSHTGKVSLNFFASFK